MEGILQAGKLEIIQELKGEVLTAENFSNVVRVARLVEDMAYQQDRPGLLAQAKNKALEATEFRAPTLHKAILADLIDSNTLISDKYKRLHQTHTELERKRLLIDAASTKLQAERAAIHEERLVMRKVHEALALGRYEDADLPELPELPALPPHPLEEDEEEEEEEKESGDRD